MKTRVALTTGLRCSKRLALGPLVTVFGRSLVFACCLGLISCEDDIPPPPSNTAVSPAVPPPAPVPEQVAEQPEKTEEKRLELTEKDFVESLENRDPFRSYLSEFLTPERQTAKIQRKVLLARYGLDELQLIAVVAGSTRARAMFRDPKGLGVAVKRGDYIGKSAGKVKQIFPNKVVVEIQEQLEGGQSVADRVIELHAESEKLVGMP